MDPEVRMRTCGTCVLQLEYMSGSGWQLASVECLVVTATVMGPLVLGWNFVREHLQGMRWDPFGAIMVGGVTCDMVGAEVRSTYSLVDMPDTRVVEYTSGRVDIISSDFLLTKGPDDQQFTCNWVWRAGEEPLPFTNANRGDYSPSLTPIEEEHLKEETQKLLDNGWIREYDGEVANILPWVLVPQPHKPSTPLRMCLDFRQLNRYLVSNPLRDMVNCRDTLHQWRSVKRGYTLDVIKCYYCIKMDPIHFKFMVVMIGGRLYTMGVLPFGICIAPKVATAAIRWLLARVPYPVSAFLDDIIIEEVDDSVVLRSNGEGKLSVDPPAVVAVREALARGGMLCKPTLVIGSAGSRALGLDLYLHEGVLMWCRRDDQDITIEVNYDEDQPRLTRREVAGWGGRLSGHVPIAGWVRPHTAILLRTLSKLPWDADVDLYILNLVDYLQTKLYREGDPAHGVWYCPRPPDAVAWHIYSDASTVAMGATLSYETAGGDKILVRDASWLLDSRAELRHVNVNELCAATRAVAWAAPFVDGRVFLHIDNECVRSWIQSYLNGRSVKRGGMSTTLVGRRLQAIYDTAEAFTEFAVLRVASEDNPSDVLSRIDPAYSRLLESANAVEKDAIDVEEDLANSGAVVSHGPLFSDSWELDLGAIVEAQYDDEDLFAIRRAIRQGRLLPEHVDVDLQQVFSECELDEFDALVRRYRAPGQAEEVCVPIIPEALRAEFVQGLHGCLCHAGQRRVLPMLTSMGWFPSIVDLAVEQLQQCDICARRTKPLLVGHDIGLFSPGMLANASPFSIVCADVVYIDKIPCLTQQCVVSKFACLVTLPGEDARSLEAAFKKAWDVIGKRPRYLLTDNATGFLSCPLQGVTKLQSPPRSSQSNGMIESFHRTIRMWLRAVLADDPDIAVTDALLKVVKAYNGSVHSTTGRIPNDMLHLNVEAPEWKRLVDKSVKDAETKLVEATKHQLYPGAIVRIRDMTKYDHQLSKTNETPYSERRWRVIGFLSNKHGLVTKDPDGDYGLYRKVKVASDGDTRILHVSRLSICRPGELDVMDLRRALRRIGRQD